MPKLEEEKFRIYLISFSFFASFFRQIINSTNVYIKVFISDRYLNESYIRLVDFLEFSVFSQDLFFCISRLRYTLVNEKL